MLKSEKDLFEKTLSSKKVFSGNLLNITLDKVELCNGKTSSREVVYHSGGVCVLPYIKDTDEILLVKQFRYPYRKVILEIPAGKVEPNEDTLNTAKRELQEETGALGKNFKSLGIVYPSPGYSAEKIYIYSCDVTQIGKTNFDEDEFLNIQRIKIQDALKMILSDQIHDAKTQIAILKFVLQNGINAQISSIYK